MPSVLGVTSVTAHPAAPAGAASEQDVTVALPVTRTAPSSHLPPVRALHAAEPRIMFAPDTSPTMAVNSAVRSEAVWVTVEASAARLSWVA